MGNSKEEKYVKLIKALDDYVVILTKELDEVVGYKSDHGWESSRVSLGKEMREKIEKLKKELPERKLYVKVMGRCALDSGCWKCKNYDGLQAGINTVPFPPFHEGCMCVVSDKTKFTPP